MVSNVNRVGNRSVWLPAATVVLLFGCCDKQPQEDVISRAGLEWVKIEGGTYMMGMKEGEGSSFEHPRHEEKIDTFEVLKTEVTVEQYAACVKDKVCWVSLDMDPNGCNWGKKDRTNHPMNCVDWYQANSFCAWAGGRLLSEAEWEYIATSRGKDYKYPWGDAPLDCEHAAIDEEPGLNCGKWKGATSPVCSRPKGNSEQGICDLMGNVHEWTGDWFYPTYDKSKHDKVPKMLNGSTHEWSYHRVLRGGGLGSIGGRHSRHRVLHDPPFAYLGLGIRCAR